MIVVDITARRHIVAKPENREANFASAALIAFARSGPPMLKDRPGGSGWWTISGCSPTGLTC